MPLKHSDSVARVTIDAGDSLYAAGLAHALLTGVDKVNHIFPPLFARQDRIREEWGWGPADQLVFVAAVDLSSDRQGGLLQKAKEAAGDAGIIDPVDFRDYYPGSQPGTSGIFAPPGGKQYPAGDELEGSAPDGHPRPRPSLSPRLSFLLGGIAAGMKSAGSTRSARAEILVVAHHFELKDSLMELNRRGAQVGIAFYRSLMEPRWERFGLYADRSPIKFYDLAPHLDEITTLGQRRPTQRATESGRSAAAQLF